MRRKINVCCKKTVISFYPFKIINLQSNGSINFLMTQLTLTILTVTIKFAT